MQELHAEVPSVFSKLLSFPAAEDQVTAVQSLLVLCRYCTATRREVASDTTLLRVGQLGNLGQLQSMAEGVGGCASLVGRVFVGSKFLAVEFLAQGCPNCSYVSNSRLRGSSFCPDTLQSAAQHTFSKHTTIVR